VSDLTEIPDALRAGLPEELKDAELAGADVAGADESCRLYGPPGAGKSTQSAFRAGTLATEEGLKPSDMTVVTYRKALAGVVRNRLIDWGVFEAPDVDPEKADSANPFQYWCTIHAAAARATGFLSNLDSQDNDLTGMVGGKAKRRFCTGFGISYLPRVRGWKPSGLCSTTSTPTRRITSSTSESGRTSRLRVSHRSGRTTVLSAVSTRFETSGDSSLVREGCREVGDVQARTRCPRLLRAPGGRLGHWDTTHAAGGHRRVPRRDAADGGRLGAVGRGRGYRHRRRRPRSGRERLCGASPRFFEEIGDRVERDLPVVQLDRSWRCPDEHFEAAARILRQERSPPTLTTAGPGQLLRHPAPGSVTTATSGGSPIRARTAAR